LKLRHLSLREAVDDFGDFVEFGLLGHRIRSVSRGLIAVDGDTLNPTLGYLQQQNAFFRIFFQVMRKPAKSLGKCGVS
jgi:hypothetical protein